MIVTTTEMQNNFGKYLQLSRHEEVIITKNGQKVAKLLPYTEGGIEGRWLVGEGSAAYSPQTIKVTYEEYLKMTAASENRYEYIDGEMILLASPLYPHQRAVRVIFVAFGLWFEDKECEPLDSPFDVTLFRLGNKDKVSVVQPDILVICDQENIDEDGKYNGTPGLVVEVLSESTRTKDLIKKLDLYMESGVQEYWAVNTESAEIYIYAFAANNIVNMLSFKGDETAKSVIYPGLSVELKKLFRS